MKGCSDATPDVALAEARRLVEQVKVDILIGPLSGSEGIAIANYSKKRPNNTFVNGTSGAQDTTLKVRSPNFFRFHTDGAQWMAGMGDYAYNTLKWRNVVTIGDDYDFPYTQNAGFVAEFCALGGKVSKRIWPPLGTKDYSSYIAQIPKSGIDGFFLTVGGTGTVAFVKEYEQLQSGSLSKKILFGSVALDPIVVEELGARVVGGVTGTDTAPDSRNLYVRKYVAQAVKNYPSLGAGAAASLFSANYWNSTWPVLQALKDVNGDLSGGQKKFRAALNADWQEGLQLAGGLHQARREPAGDRRQLPDPADRSAREVQDAPDDSEDDAVVLGVLHDVDTDAVAQSARVRETHTSVVGRQVQDGGAEVAGWRQPHHTRAPSRSSACGGSAGASAASRPCATSTSTSRTASVAPSSARTAPGRRRSST